MAPIMLRFAFTCHVAIGAMQQQNCLSVDTTIRLKTNFWRRSCNSMLDVSTIANITLC